MQFEYIDANFKHRKLLLTNKNISQLTITTFVEFNSAAF